MNIKNLKKDKLFLILLIIIILLGIFIRFYKFSEVGYWNDDMSTIPGGLIWFYPPYPYFPGLASTEPPLGNMLIGASCMLSGQDFSAVRETVPGYFPNRFELIGEAMSKAGLSCHLSTYIFGILFFIIIIIFSLLILPKYSALYLISFFAFYPKILQLSRWIRVDIILYTLILISLLFLYKAYSQEKYSKKEKIYFILSFIFLGLALATKLTAALIFIFAIFILFKKYSDELLIIIKKLGKKLNLDLINKIQNRKVNFKSLFSIIIFSAILFTIFLLVFLKFNPMNLFEVYKTYKTFNPGMAKFGVNPITALQRFYSDFILNLNILDLLIFFFSIIVFVKILFKKQKSKFEKFSSYLFILYFITLLISPSLRYFRTQITFLFGIFFLMALTFSNENYSIFKLFKIRKKRLFFLIFIIVYILFSSYTAFSTAPYFSTNNRILCHIEDNCVKDYSFFASKATADYLKTVLKDDETFIGVTGIIHFYIRPDQENKNYLFDQAFKKQIGREPTLKEKIQYFHPNNQTIRYLLINPNRYTEEQKVFINNFEPNKKIILAKKTSMLIYDLKNLQEK